MKRHLYYAILVLSISCTKHHDSPVTPAGPTTPPAISATWPNNNPAGWPVMIKGTNLGKITKITFNDQVAPIDTAFDTVATTRVPAGLPAGIVNLVLTNGAGKSQQFPFTILPVAPAYPPMAQKIIIPRPPRYLPALPNGNQTSIGWADQYGPNYFITFTNTGTNFETWNGEQNFFQILNFPDSADGYAIQISIERDTSTVVYNGNFIAMDDPASTAQRILFYDSNYRQIVIVNN